MDIAKLFDTAIAELEKMLSTKTVVGEPIRLDNTTIVPLVSIGFGFGVGGGQGQAPGGKGGGEGGATAGGGGVKPMAVLIVDEHGARVESVRAVSSVLSKVAEGVTELARNRLRPGDSQESTE